MSVSDYEIAIKATAERKYELAEKHLHLAKLSPDPDVSHKALSLIFDSHEVDLLTEDDIKWLSKMSDEGNSFAQTQLGFLYKRECPGFEIAKNMDKAIQLFELSAKQDNPYGAMNLGLYYSTTDSIDLGKAITYYKIAEKHLKLRATRAIAMLYNSLRYYNHSFKYYHRLAIQGDRASQYRVAEMYNNAVGVEKNDNLYQSWRELYFNQCDTSHLNY